MVAYLPFIMIIMVLIFKERDLMTVVHDRKKVYINGFALFFLLLYIGISVYMDVMISMPKFDSSKNHAVTEKYFAATSSEKTILAPMEFVFNEIGNYHAIHGLLQYNEHLKTDSSYYGKGLLEHAAGNDVDCIYLNAKYMKIFGLTHAKQDSIISGYRVIGSAPDLLVLERN